MRFACLLVALLAFQDGVVRDKHANGRTRLEYRVDADGKKHGSYAEYFETGKKKVTGTYDHGIVDGSWDEYADSGKIVVRKKYAKGAIQELIRVEDKNGPAYQVNFTPTGPTIGIPGGKEFNPIHDRKREDITAKLAELEGPPYAGPKVIEPFSVKSPYKAGKLHADYQADGIRHLSAYRWLCGLSTDLEFDPAKAEACQHGALILAVLKQLTHYPEKPADMDEEFFKKAHEGTSKSNISSYSKTPRASVDAFMDDSDPTNIRKIGHRMWIMNPEMKKVAFGQVDLYVCQWSVDNSGAGVIPEHNRFPAAGFHPVEYFLPHYAWNCQLPSGKFKPGLKPGEVTVRMWRLTAEYALENELTVGDITVNGGNVIFRPKLDTKAKLDGLRFMVQIKGLKQGKNEGPVQYVTEFYSTKPAVPEEK